MNHQNVTKGTKLYTKKQLNKNYTYLRTNKNLFNTNKTNQPNKSLKTVFNSYLKVIESKIFFIENKFVRIYKKSTNLSKNLINKIRIKQHTIHINLNPISINSSPRKEISVNSNNKIVNLLKPASSSYTDPNSYKYNNLLTKIRSLGKDRTLINQHNNSFLV